MATTPSKGTRLATSGPRSPTSKRPRLSQGQVAGIVVVVIVSVVVLAGAFGLALVLR